MKTKFLSAVALCMLLAMASCSKKDAQVSTSDQSPEVATEQVAESRQDSIAETVKEPEKVECPDCNGKGKVKCKKCKGDGCTDIPGGVKGCKSCGGSGYHYIGDTADESSVRYGKGEVKCKTCKGEGKIIQ